MLNFLFASAQAQDAAAAAPAANPMMQFLPLIAVFFIFYFLMIRPQKKRIQEEEAMLKALTKGDEIYTKSGIIGTVVGLTDKIATLEVSEGVKMKVLRAHIAGKMARLLETNPAPAKA
jgi:preprotein translocase subunit YajC